MNQLSRSIGISGAVFLGLGSIVGTGVFVSIGIAAGVAGSWVVVAIMLAAIVAICNGFSSAQLAANHPVSGGTYEYGYQFLAPPIGFLAGWMFIVAKGASAATAALGFAGYVTEIGGINSDFSLILALAAVAILTAVVAGGIRRSARVNAAIVTVTLAVLAFFIVAGLVTGFQPHASGGATSGLQFRDFDLRSVLGAAALMFVAYTGYGRIATLGEEVKSPRRTIPKAIGITLLITMFLYILVSVAGVVTLGTEGLSKSAAPLEAAANTFGVPGAGTLLAIGAVVAMLGVLLNLILGLSRVVLAMSRRRDVPSWLSGIRTNRAGIDTPTAAVLVVGLIIAILVAIGDVKTTWSFSAMTVLVYYAITNVAAIALGPTRRLYPVSISIVGLIGCLGLAAFIDVAVLRVGIVIVAAAVVWFGAAVLIRR